MSTDDTNATASICPSGNGSNWVLPLGKSTNNGVSGSYYNLLNKYSAATGPDTSSGANIVKLPLAYVRGGYVSLSYGVVDAVGNYGYGWSRTSYSAGLAYDLSFLSGGVDPSNDTNRRYGLPLRCLYLGSV